MAKTWEARIIEDPPKPRIVARRETGPPGKIKFAGFQCEKDCGIEEVCREHVWMRGNCLDSQMRWAVMGGGSD